MKKMLDELWLEDALTFLFDMFPDKDLQELEVIEPEDEMMSFVAGSQYAEIIFPYIYKNMIDIPVNIVTSLRSKKSTFSKNKVSKLKGSPILHISKTKDEDNEFGISAFMELWLLEDGRFAEITCIQFEAEGFVTLRREFKKIIKKKNQLFFNIYELEESLQNMEMSLLLEELYKEKQ